MEYRTEHILLQLAYKICMGLREDYLTFHNKPLFSNPPAQI